MKQKVRVGQTWRFAPLPLCVGLVLMVAGCGFKRAGTAQLIPPSATGLQAPIYPPTTFNSTSRPPMPQGFSPRGVTNPAPVAPAPATPAPEPRFDNSAQSGISNSAPTPAMVPNTPVLTPTNVIELSAVGMGVAPESTISPSQALALAKRAAIVDGYRQLGEKMYGIRVNATDTVKDMILQNSVIKTKVNALIRNAEITETIYKDGLCQVSMELKLDGRIWYSVFNAGRG